ncbi:hypothetical protein [Flammeovirga aprica]|uniref:TIGR04255 family protein n=1 Tax=Flammeovirga aprica JL-4 TaxID=694437 RepID=A0A7X9XA34_9BACT|nr:hypothetical protein [Flammeovirga aprica]NME69297.1 hypothetical protein [Flammeovirga aprica JL-4]
MKENLLQFIGLQLDDIHFKEEYFQGLFINPFVEEFKTMELKYEVDREFVTVINKEFDFNTIINFLSSDEYKKCNINIHLRSDLFFLQFTKLGDNDDKDERDYDKKYSNTSIDLYFDKRALNEDKFEELFNYYKPLFLELTVPIRYDLRTLINDETTNGIYTNEIMFRHLNDFPFTGISICWKMILGELKFDEDYTFEKISQTPALYNTTLLKQVDGRDYNLIELHTYKDFYNYESDESMKSLRETYGYLREAMLELEKEDMIPPLEERFQL